MEQALDGAVEARAAGEQPFAGLGEPLAGIVAQDGRGKLGDAKLMATQMGGESRFLAEAEVVEALGKAVQHRGDARFGAIRRGGAGEKLAGLQELEADGALEALKLDGQVICNFVVSLGDEFGGGRRRRRAQVGGEVGDGEVGFVANGGDDGQAGGNNGARHALAVESGQVFKRSAAAGKDNQIDEAAGVQLAHGATAQWQVSQPVPTSQLQPGDLLFYHFANDGPWPITHVAMYVGSGPYGAETIIQAASTGTDVGFYPMYWSGLVGAGRP